MKTYVHALFIWLSAEGVFWAPALLILMYSFLVFPIWMQMNDIDRNKAALMISFDIISASDQWG